MEKLTFWDDCHDVGPAYDCNPSAEGRDWDSSDAGFRLRALLGSVEREPVPVRFLSLIAAARACCRDAEPATRAVD